MANKTLGISFGALSDKLNVQLKRQEFKFKKEDVEHFEKDIDALNRLRIRGYLTDSATDNATKKLYRKIENHILKENDLHRVKA